MALQALGPFDYRCAVLERLVSQFDIMFDNHAYTHWYEGAGVNRAAMASARDCVAELAKSYRDAS